MAHIKKPIGIKGVWTIGKYQYHSHHLFEPLTIRTQWHPARQATTRQRATRTPRPTTELITSLRVRETLKDFPCILLDPTTNGRSTAPDKPLDTSDTYSSAQ